MQGDSKLQRWLICKQIQLHLAKIMTVEHCIAHCLILTRLDYFNSVFYGLPEPTLLPSTRILQQAARLSLGLSYCDHVTPVLCALHRLPIRERIRFKLALLMYKACINHLPSYLSYMVTPCSSVNGRSSFRSASDGSMLILARVLSLAGGHLLSPVPLFGISYHLMSTILSQRLSFTLSSKLTSSALPMDSSDFSASVCTSELCKEGYIKLQLYCIVFYIFVQCRSQEFMMGGLGLIIMYLAILNVVIFMTDGKCSISTLKISFFPKLMGGFNPRNSIGYATGIVFSYWVQCAS